VRHGLQQLIELEVAAVLGADRHERSENRLGYRNGNRPRLLSTQVGDINLQIPKLRAGSFLPSILEPRRRVDQALYGVVMEAYIGGISTRKVDALVAALGVQSGISKSQVSRICADIDIQVQAFLNRPVFLDATYLHGRLGLGLQVCSRAAVIAMGVNADGRRELLGLQVGDSESEGFWKTFIGSLKERGFTGVKLVVSDAHVGLTKAIRRMFQGCCWQRCRVHHRFAEGFAYARNLLQRVPKAHQGMFTAALRSVFSQEDATGLVERWDDLASSLTERFPKAAELMLEAKEDVLAFRHFPQPHWKKVWSTNLLERLNEEVKRGTRVVGIFPNDSSITRLVGAVLLEQDESWQLEGRRMFSADSMVAIPSPNDLPAFDEDSAA
jgi:putative transposase